jgi:hypothetical protein
MLVTSRAIAASAATELGTLGQGETMSAADLAQWLDLLRALLNAWNADRRAVYATAFDTYTLVPNLFPHTIGPTGTFTTTARPVDIDGANLILPATTVNFNGQITIRDAQWWLSQSVPQLTSDIPTDLYYQPDYPNGKIYFWPVPSTAYQVQLMTRVLLDDVALTTSSYELPPGYYDAIRLTLAEKGQRPFGRPPDVTLINDASKARAVVFDNNVEIPRLRTKDPGMTPGKGGFTADFNWLNGQIV